MSLILDALNKADNERQKDNAPTLQSVHESPYTPHHTARKNGLLYGFIICVCIIVGLVAYVFLTKNTTPQQSPNSAPAQSQQQEKATGGKPFTRQTAPITSTTATNPAINPNAKENAQRERQRLIAEQYQQADTEEDERETNADTTAAQPQNTANQAASDNKKTVQKRDVSNLYTDSEAEEIPAKKSVTPKVDTTQNSASKQNHSPAKSSPQKTEQLANKIMDNIKKPDGIGTIRELPTEVQRKIPTLMYREHNYTSSPKTIKLNKGIYQEGQQVAPDLYLEEIQEKSIIMRYQQHRFRMPAMNSWVNM